MSASGSGRPGTGRGVGLGAGLSAIALAAAAATAQATPSQERPKPVAQVTVNKRPEDTRAKLEHIQREVDGTKLTVTRKSSVVLLDHVPTVIGENVRELFVRTPGLLAAEPAAPARVDLAYRGLASPPGSQGLLVLQDGLPISADVMGEPRLGFLPFTQSLSQAQLLRGGSSLVYGPDAAALNLVSRRPQAGAPLSGYSEQVGGSDGLWSSWNALEGSRGAFDVRADLGWIRSDGDRANGASTLGQVDAWLGWRPAKGQLWYLALQAYRASAGEPGPMGERQFRADPGAATTPDDHDWLGRYSATVGTELDLAQGWRLEGKLRFADEDLFQRAVIGAAGGSSPDATLQDSLFRSEIADVRLKKSWGHGNAFSFGVEAAHDSSPLRQWTGAGLGAGPGDRAGVQADLRQARTSDYRAIFAENVFRLPRKVHLVPSVRLEHEEIAVRETLKPPGLARPPIDAGGTRDTPLFGLGVGNDFGKDNETYFSVTQGWRPLRFGDLASPFTGPQPKAAADAGRSLAFEAGVHGTPLKGLFYDASLFWIEVKNRIESQPLNALEWANVNTGDVRDRGFEGELVYDLLSGRPGGAHLEAFSSLTLLDARFTRSDLPGQVGRVPSFAPHALAKAGLTFRRDRAFDVSLSATSASSQFFQDSDQAAGAGPGGAGAGFVPAKIPGFTVFDLSGDLWLSPRLKLLGGVRNLGDVRYWSEASALGLAPAPRRTLHAGLSVAF